MIGNIKIILGPMFSGKSSEIIRLINRYKILNKKILAINHEIDNRYGENKIISHNKEKIDCINLKNLKPIMETEDYKNSEVIVIEEAQFFSDLYEFVVTSADKYHKNIIVAGLDGDYQKKPFGDLLRLIPHAESVVKLHALCLKCNDGTKAAFTKRIIDNDKKILVGSSENYQPVCRKHFLED